MRAVTLALMATFARSPSYSVPPLLPLRWRHRDVGLLSAVLLSAATLVLASISVDADVLSRAAVLSLPGAAEDALPLLRFRVVHFLSSLTAAHAVLLSMTHYYRYAAIDIINRSALTIFPRRRGCCSDCTGT
ncbi:hypothetical protein HYPSUDRAFT_216877 [Hypholoma sublateritium FD-334 SS-4]|uniref:Uncharacterized protein n=1 Tax=Hypholoma sublateritium (strain FD-334 SS-4) TaxID=945553 RepID=A0A0D2MB89_HYPSF|nr:hypothetical protein HYPSUDRAFT_216877 [Hypholoma sublateritium FD-334 SS-4]